VYWILIARQDYNFMYIGDRPRRQYSMKINPTRQHFLNLIADVDCHLITTCFSESHISLCVLKNLHRWQQKYDVSSMGTFYETMLESFQLAALRGFSGYPEDLERSIRSLNLNVQYYRARLQGMNSNTH
jgi:hypothetical protein